VAVAVPEALLIVEVPAVTEVAALSVIISTTSATADRENIFPNPAHCEPSSQNPGHRPYLVVYAHTSGLAVTRMDVTVHICEIAKLKISMPNKHLSA